MKEITIILSSSWKFAATFPAAIYLFDMSFFETILYTNIGGILGIIVFALISRGILHICPTKRNSPKQKTFSRRKRKMVRIKNKYGIWGIVLLTPVILSIPIGVFLLTRYYHKKRCYLWMTLGLFAWSFAYTWLYMGIETFFRPLIYGV